MYIVCFVFTGTLQYGLCLASISVVPKHDDSRLPTILANHCHIDHYLPILPLKRPCDIKHNLDHVIFHSASDIACRQNRTDFVEYTGDLLADGSEFCAMHDGYEVPAALYRACHSVDDLGLRVLLAVFHHLAPSFQRQSFQRGNRHLLYEVCWICADPISVAPFQLPNIEINHHLSEK